VGDNIWVEFGAGDINNPIWTGVWYPQDKTPKTADEQAPTEDQKIIRTAAGHVLQLDDSSGAEKILLVHKTGSTVEIDQDGKITITDKGEDMSIVSKKISLGTRGGAGEPLVLGDTLEGKLNKLLDAFMNHTHPTGVGPSGIPVQVLSDLIELKTTLFQIKSTRNTTD
jgi:hypothetical protein